jgi:molecular chaperone DnaJ
MDLKTAYSILELNENASPEEAKKQYRNLTKKYHPDINKEPGAEDKFKKINEAYQCVQSGKGNEEVDQFAQNCYYQNPFININDFIDFKQNRFNNSTIQINETISFKESVFGCKKTLKYNRDTKCSHCNGNGFINKNNGCTKCNGQGRITIKQGNSIFIQTCDKCFGQAPKDPCQHCNSTGIINLEASVQVTIPGGVKNGNVLRLNRMGNYCGGGIMGMDQYSDVFLLITVIQDPDITLCDNNVISNVNLTLLEALTGCTKIVRTLDGDKEINITPKIRHHEIISLPNLGVNRVGNHNFIVNIDYPDNVDNIISMLKDGTEIKGF